MDHDELTAAMQQLEDVMEERAELWRVIIAPNGDVIRRVFRNYIRLPRGPRSEPREQEERNS